MKVIIEAIGTKQVARELLRFGEHVENPQPLFAQIGKDLRLIEQVQFLTEGQHGSGGWPELKDATVAAKKRKELEPWILRATNALFDSLTKEGDPMGIHEVTRDFLRFGTHIPYAVHHQFGAPRANLPRRRVVDLTSTERNMIVKRVQRFVVSGEL